MKNRMSFLPMSFPPFEPPQGRLQRESIKLMAHQPSGVSLIIAVLFTSAFMLVMAGMFETFWQTTVAIRNRETQGKMAYMAKSVAEIGLAWQATAGIGTNGKSTESDFATAHAAYQTTIEQYALRLYGCQDTDSTAPGNQPCISFEVRGRSEDVDAQKVYLHEGDSPAQQYMSVPMKGTGKAGPCKYSSDAAANFPEDAADSSCNWDKLYAGDSVEIPLYSYAPDGTIALHDYTAANTEFRLRVRAPCEGFETGTVNCAEGGRVILYPAVLDPAYRMISDTRDTGTNPGHLNPKDPVLVQWMITDADASVSEPKALLARDDVVSRKRSLGDSDFDNHNTELSAGRINLAKSGLALGAPFYDFLENFTVLEFINASALGREKHKGQDLERNPQEIGIYIRDQIKPTLRLSLVGQPQKDGDGNVDFNTHDINDRTLDIPYLEYQVLSKGVQISDTKSVITGVVELGDFRKEITINKKRPATLGGFALESF